MNNTHQDNEADKNAQFYSDEDTRKTFSYLVIEQKFMRLLLTTVKN